ncbi:MAG: HAD hydrolase-like protein [Propionibacteriaceae bacterium]|nr:HAD hydrolase-like protein [Propionibacteriaceae bacterium]
MTPLTDVYTHRPQAFFDAYLFDLDGTIYLGDEVLPGVRETMTALREAGKVVRFLSNNPTKSPEQYAEKLTAMGIEAQVSEITNTIVTTLWWLRTHHPGATVYPIAEVPLMTALSEAGFTISEDPSRIDVVISSYDRGFGYSKLQIAFDALWFYKRAILIETNPDRYCPFPGGRGEPDAAAITAAIEACTQVKCVASMGKPSELMVRAGLAGLDIPLDRCVMVGDRLATDIRMALNLGMPAAVVFTGETKPQDVTVDYANAYRLDTIDQLIPLS